MNLDVEAQAQIDKNPNNMIYWYLVASYGYYIENESIFSDDFFDQLCKSIHDKFDQLEHYHKYLLDKESLLAGTGFHLKVLPPSPHRCYSKASEEEQKAIYAAQEEYGKTYYKNNKTAPGYYPNIIVDCYQDIVNGKYLK